LSTFITIQTHNPLTTHRDGLLKKGNGLLVNVLLSKRYQHHVTVHISRIQRSVVTQPTATLTIW